MNKKLKIKLLIFDFDGTLVDSKKDIISSVNWTLREFGMPEKSSGEITGFIGTGLRQLMVDSLSTKDDGKIDQAIKIYMGYYRKHMFDTTGLYPNVKRILDYFAKKKKAIISNKSAESIRMICERFGIEKYFFKVIGGDDDKCRKPDPCTVTNLMQGLDIQPSEAVIIGDSPLDIQTGKAAGILTCGATYGIGDPDEIKAQKPDFVIDDIGQLRDLLE